MAEEAFWALEPTAEEAVFFLEAEAMGFWWLFVGNSEREISFKVAIFFCRTMNFETNIFDFSEDEDEGDANVPLWFPLFAFGGVKSTGMCEAWWAAASVEGGRWKLQIQSGGNDEELVIIRYIVPLSPKTALTSRRIGRFLGRNLLAIHGYPLRVDLLGHIRWHFYVLLLTGPKEEIVVFATEGTISFSNVLKRNIILVVRPSVRRGPRVRSVPTPKQPCCTVWRIPSPDRHGRYNAFLKQAIGLWNFL